MYSKSFQLAGKDYGMVNIVSISSFRKDAVAADKSTSQNVHCSPPYLTVPD